MEVVLPGSIVYPNKGVDVVDLDPSKHEGTFPELTIITNWSGRWFTFESVLSALESIDYPKDKIRYVWITNSSSTHFVQALENESRLWNKRGLSVELSIFNSDFSGEFVYSEGMVLDRIPHYKISAAMQKLAFSAASTDLVMFWEDDHINPSHCARRLRNWFLSDPKVAVAGGIYYGRHDTETWTVWNAIRVNGHTAFRPVDFTRSLKPKTVGAMGFGCTMMRRSLLEGFDWSVDSREDDILGVDCRLGMHVNRLGNKIVADPDVLSYHIRSDGSITFEKSRGVAAHAENISPYHNIGGGL